MCAKVLVHLLQSVNRNYMSGSGEPAVGWRCTFSHQRCLNQRGRNLGLGQDIMDQLQVGVALQAVDQPLQK